MLHWLMCCFRNEILHWLTIGSASGQHFSLLLDVGLLLAGQSTTDEIAKGSSVFVRNDIVQQRIDH